MAEQDIIEKLKSLTNRQKEVLKGFCEGKPLKDIANELFLSIETIKTHMGHVYLKLGLTDLPPTLRKKIIFEEYWPVFKEFDFVSSVIHQDEPEDTEEPEPIPEKVIEIVEKDELALVVVKPITIEIISDENEEMIDQDIENEKPPINWWQKIIQFSIIAVLLFWGSRLLGIGGNLRIDNSGQVIQEMGNIDEIVEKTIQAQQITQPTVIPTNMDLNSSNNTELLTTLIPTRTPSSRIKLPFNDDFSKGFNSAWDLQFADWIITDGKASIIQTENLDTGWLIINDPTLDNYRLKVHINTPHMYSAAQGETFILIRYDQNRDKQLLLKLSRLTNVFWGTTRGFQNSIEPITNATKYEYPASADVVIEANGNTFTAWVAGQMVGEISLSGYDHGGIGIGIFCSYTDCPTLSDFSLEPIN